MCVRVCVCVRVCARVCVCVCVSVPSIMRPQFCHQFYAARTETRNNKHDLFPPPYLLPGAHQLITLLLLFLLTYLCCGFCESRYLKTHKALGFLLGNLLTLTQQCFGFCELPLLICILVQRWLSSMLRDIRCSQPACLCDQQQRSNETAL